MNYSTNDIDLWRTGSTFIRPKWGIYRSLNHPGQLRDEKVLFADFVIEKKRQVARGRQVFAPGASRAQLEK